MKSLVVKSAEKVDLVKGFCASTCPTAKACIPLDQHRKFEGCNLDSAVVNAAESDLLLTFASQALSLLFNITEDQEMREAARRFKEKAAEAMAWKRANAWEVPPGLDATQVMLEHTLHFLCTR